MATGVTTDTANSTGISTNGKSTNGSGLKERAAGGSSDDLPRESAAGSSLRSKKLLERKYKHVYAIHSQPRTSCLSHESVEAPSFLGFRNLMVLVLSKSSSFEA